MSCLIPNMQWLPSIFPDLRDAALRPMDLENIEGHWRELTAGLERSLSGRESEHWDALPQLPVHPGAFLGVQRMPGSLEELYNGRVPAHAWGIEVVLEVRAFEYRVWKTSQMGEALKMQESERSLHKQAYVFTSTCCPTKSLDGYFEAKMAYTVLLSILLQHCLCYFPFPYLFFTFSPKCLLPLLQPCFLVSVTSVNKPIWCT